jgi:hypothetical protein
MNTYNRKFARRQWRESMGDMFFARNRRGVPETQWRVFVGRGQMNPKSKMV